MISVRPIIFTGNKNEEERDLCAYKAIAELCKPINFLPYGGDELLVGRAGYICGAVWLEKVEGRKVLSDKEINDLCVSTVETGKRNAQSHRRPLPPLTYSYYDTEYIGKSV